VTSVTIKSHRAEVEGKITDNLQKSLAHVGALVERQAKVNVSQSPPSHPQVQTGNLRSNIIHVVSPGKVEIGTNVVYGKWLEFGHADGSRHYPWLFPAVEMKRAEIIETLKGNII